MKIGTTVEWTSQSQGSALTKRGVIVAVIPANGHVMDHLSGLQKTYARGWGLMPRKEESYVVHVPSASGRGNGKLYWPHAGLLREVGAPKEELMRDAAPELYEA
jgi:hypothetical protein